MTWDPDTLLGFVLRVISIGIILFYVTPKQLREVLEPRDWLTKLRWTILSLLLLTVTAAIPGLVYQYLRVRGIDNQTLRSVVTVTGNVSYLGMALLYVVIYRYKDKDKDKDE